MKRYLPAFFFLAAATAGLSLTYVMYRTENTANRLRFEFIADEAVDGIQERINQHIALLVATHSFYEANQQQVSQRAFQAFVAGLDLSGRYEGIRGIGFARLIATGEELDAEADLQRNYGLTRTIWPQTDNRRRAAIVLLEPQDARNQLALGYDMFSEPRRRMAMRRAMVSGETQASAPVELVQEVGINQQAGFLVYIPVFANPAGTAGADRDRDTDTEVEGFIYAPFRAGDLHRAVLSKLNLPVLIETTDKTNENGALLFRSDGFPTSTGERSQAVLRRINVAGRTWEVSILDAAPENGIVAHWRSFVVAFVSLLFAVALAASIQARTKAIAATRQMRETSIKTNQEKDLMLQEMKHRIKNSISRILAMARQTAANSESIDDFTSSFSARMQAMANAQDMLTRTGWQRADLRELLVEELRQVFGVEMEDVDLDGPKVLLDERTTHALGLVFHELATNAMKYGCMSAEGGSLTVEWALTGRTSTPSLNLQWAESIRHRVEPATGGFGTRLIDASVKGELSGTVDRRFEATGLTVEITIPIS